MLVKVVRCPGQSMPYLAFLDKYRIKFKRLTKSPWCRYDVLQESFDCNGDPMFISKGHCFKNGCVWVFVPANHPSNLEKWYFGQTRLDCLSKFFNS